MSDTLDLDALEAVAKAGNALDSATCQALIARMRRAEEVLKVFAREADDFEKDWPHAGDHESIENYTGIDIRVGDLRRAREALALTQKDPAP